MTNKKFERAARLNRAKAILLTLTLHIVLIGGITAYGGGSVSDMVPEKVKNLLGWEEQVKTTENSKSEVAIRP